MRDYKRSDTIKRHYKARSKRAPARQRVYQSSGSTCKGRANAREYGEEEVPETSAHVGISKSCDQGWSGIAEGTAFDRLGRGHHCGDNLVVFAVSTEPGEQDARRMI